MMFESMIGEQGVKAVDECKRLLPSVPILIQNIKTEWESMRTEQARMTQLLERIATQNEVILGKIENLGFKIDPTKVCETPPTLMHLLEQEGVAERFTSDDSVEDISYRSINGSVKHGN